MRKQQREEESWLANSLSFTPPVTRQPPLQKYAQISFDLGVALIGC
jgi:hypothetical protein